MVCTILPTPAVAQQTPLHWAARHGHLEVARGLIANGASVDVRDTLQRTPLHLAVQNEDMIRFLVNVGADVNATDALANTPLHLAVRFQGEVSVLLELGALVNPRNTLGDTPIEIAVRQGSSRQNLRIVSSLVEAGASNEIQ
jgi:ankyrin repeat protein